MYCPRVWTGGSSQSLSWNLEWARGSPGAPGEGGQRAGTGVGRTLAARVGVPVGRGWGAVSVVRSGVLTAAGKAPGARQGRGEPGRRGAGVGSWRGWGRASQLCSRRWPLRLEMPRERTLGGVNPGFAGRDSDGCGWGFGPSCAPGGLHCG